MNQTIDTLRETAALRETLSRVTRPIAVASRTDDGEWVTRTFANEPAAVEFETRCRRRDVPTRRVCSRCGILVRPEGGHCCGSCGENV